MKQISPQNHKVERITRGHCRRPFDMSGSGRTVFLCPLRLQSRIPCLLWLRKIRSGRLQRTKCQPNNASSRVVSIRRIRIWENARRCELAIFVIAIGPSRIQDLPSRWWRLDIRRCIAVQRSQIVYSYVANSSEPREHINLTVRYY